MENKKHWQSFGELNNSQAYQQSSKDEFKEELPFEADDNSSFLQTGTPRRDFLKYLGFSTAAAALAASCDVPVKKAIPLANKPENMIPGVAQWYATTYVQDGDVVSIIAKVRDGRPIKIEGNTLSPIFQGGTSARVQASVLDLYDTARVRTPMIKGSGNKFDEATFESIDKAIAADISGKAVVLLTSTITSPSTKEVIAQFLAKYPGSRHVTYDAVSNSGMLLANEQTGHGRILPSYRFDNAKTIVSLAADFLGTWLSPVEFNKQYAKTRRLDEKNPTMSKHIQFEAVLSQTGSNADERYLCLPSQMGAIAAALLGAVNGTAPSGMDAALTKGITTAAAELKKGGGLVVSGSNDVNVQIIVNAINAAIGANGTTIDWSNPVNYRQGIDADMAALINDMNGGKVGALLIHGANPAYSWVDDKAFTSALSKVPVTISFNSKIDETSALCKYIIPDHHYLESWGDAEPKRGHYSFLQPTIAPLFKTRQWQDSLLMWGGTAMPYAAYLKQYWAGRSGGEAGWDKILQDGILSPGGASVATSVIDSIAGPKPPVVVATAGGSGSFNGSAVQTAVDSFKGKKGGTYELFLYQKVGVGNGSGASNPWLMELPDPVTRATWDNYAIVSPEFARKNLGIDLNNSGQADKYEAYPSKPVVEVSINGRAVKLPALIIPGTHTNAIGIAVGYGRIASFGKATQVPGDTDRKIGNQNVYQFATLTPQGTVDLANINVGVKATGEDYKVALTQTHNTYDTSQGKRTEVMKEISLATFVENRTEILDERAKELAPWGGLKDYEKKGTIYPVNADLGMGLKWGMSIDLNTCTGCHACVVACHVENNVPVVGKHEVMRFHDMHWLRIDRYYSGDVNNPNVVFQPMLCQHCDNAPCENVCPVAATMHNSEGVNQMAYNRCIGTRYCANNCPYKVRRFNWSDYYGSDSFPDNNDEWDEFQINMNDPLTRMVLNPDVVVRSRGVMEKCSFCVQRTQEGKLQAKKESRPLVTGEGDKWDVKAACQQACPTDAIMFGNVKSKESAITHHRALNINRTYYSLEQLHTLPNVNYLAKVRNVDPASMDEGHEVSGAGKTEEKKPAEAHSAGH